MGFDKLWCWLLLVVTSSLAQLYAPSSLLDYLITEQDRYKKHLAMRWDFQTGVCFVVLRNHTIDIEMTLAEVERMDQYCPI